MLQGIIHAITLFILMLSIVYICGTIIHSVLVFFKEDGKIFDNIHKPYLLWLAFAYILTYIFF